MQFAGLQLIVKESDQSLIDTPRVAFCMRMRPVTLLIIKSLSNLLFT